MSPSGHAILGDLEARVPLETATKLYAQSAARTGDAAFGLHVAERSDYFAFDALGFAISTKPSLREAFESLAAAITALHGTRMELEAAIDGKRLAERRRLRGLGTRARKRPLT